VIVLGIETSTDSAGVSLADDNGVLAEINISRTRRYVETIVPAIETLLRIACMDISVMDAVAVDTGPGLYTGLRVGVATAKSLCFALGIKAVAVGSLELLAHAVSRTIGTGYMDGWTILTVIDAKRGEVFWNTYTVRKGQAITEGAAKVSPPSSIESAIHAGVGSEENNRPMLVVGNGAVRYKDELSRIPGVSFAGPAFYGIPAGVLSAVGVQRVLAGESISADGLAIQYLREPDAVVNWKIRDGLSRIAP
jgi:tRNA threonylcarbamoyladenosine biosynthesis protein TsaB